MVGVEDVDDYVLHGKPAKVLGSFVFHAVLHAFEASSEKPIINNDTYKKIRNIKLQFKILWSSQGKFSDIEKHLDEKQKITAKKFYELFPTKGFDMIDGNNAKRTPMSEFLIKFVLMPQPNEDDYKFQMMTKMQNLHNMEPYLDNPQVDAIKNLYQAFMPSSWFDQHPYKFEDPFNPYYDPSRKEESKQLRAKYIKDYRERHNLK